MSKFKEAAARIRAFFSARSNGQLDEELQFHAEMLTAEFVAKGLPDEEARLAAFRELGNRTAIEQAYREQRSLPLLESFLQDLRFSVRTLLRSPGFTVPSILTVAIGLSGVITVASLISTFLWTSLPYPAADHLVVIKEVDPRAGLWPFSQPTFLDLQQRTMESLAGVAALRRDASALTGFGQPESIQTAAVTRSFPAMFGMQPLLGRVVRSPHDSVVISRSLWNRRWHGSRDAIGSVVQLNGRSYNVSGVADMPADLLPGVELLSPLEPSAAESRSAHEIEAFGRIRKGYGREQAQAELTALAAGLAREHPASNVGWRMKIIPLAEYVVGTRTTQMLWMIFAGVGLIWLLACANGAGLQVARRISRNQEIATRLTLGASRARLLRQSLTESGLIVLVGTALGMAVSNGLLPLVRHFGTEFFPRLANLHLDGKTVAAAAACLLATTLLLGAIPMPLPKLSAQRGTTPRGRGRDVLVIAQVALACVLVLCAGLLLQSFLHLEAVNPGFDPQRLWTARVARPSSLLSAAQRTAFLTQLTESLGRVPGVASVGASNIAPFSGWGTANRFRLEGATGNSEFQSAAWRAVTPGFFRALNVPIKKGRLFSDADTESSLQVVIITESMATQFLPNTDPIGKRLLWGSSASPKVIVGVVADLRDVAVGTPPAPTMFRPFAQLSEAPMTMLIRTSTDSPELAERIRKAIWAADPNLPVELRRVRTTMSESLLEERSSLAIMAALASMALVIAAFGLYALVSYRVTQRRFEIGIRLALGASPASVQWNVQRRSLTIVCAGLLLGLPAAFGLSKAIAALLYQTSPMNPRAYLGVLILFVAVALAASYGPAHRAVRLDPASEIRQE